MSSVAHPSPQKGTVPTIYRWQRRTDAASIILGAAAVLVAAFANPPYYGSGPGPASAVATNAADSDLMDQRHVVAQLIAAYLLPLGFLAMAWLASLGAFLAILGFLPLALYVGRYPSAAESPAFFSLRVGALSYPRRHRAGRCGAALHRQYSHRTGSAADAERRASFNREQGKEELVMLAENPQTRTYPLIIRLLIAGGVVGPILFILVLLVEGATRPGYDAWRMAGSALSLSDQGWMQITNFIVSGLLILGFAVGVRQTRGLRRGGTWGPILLAVAGMGLIIAGIFVTDPASGYPPGTPDGPALHPTWHGTLHFFPGGLAFFIGLSAACFVFARRFAGDPHWKSWATPSVAVGVLVLAFLVAYAVVAARVPGGGPAGLLERISIILGLAWIALFALRLLSQTRTSVSSAFAARTADGSERAGRTPEVT